MDEVDFVVDPEIAFQSELIKGMNTGEAIQILSYIPHPDHWAD